MHAYNELPVTMVRSEPFAAVVPALLQIKRMYWHFGACGQLALSRLRTTAEDDPLRFSQATNRKPGVLFKDSDFSVLIKEAEFLKPVLDAVLLDAGPNRQCCNARIVELAPRTCQAYHQNAAEYQYHLPMVTGHSCFWVVDDYIMRARRVGALYRLRTGLMHTAVNASDTPRLHLVISVS